MILDRNTPVARLVPYEDEGGPLSVRHPLGRYKTVGAVPILPPVPQNGDIVGLLLEDRQGRT